MFPAVALMLAMLMAPLSHASANVAPGNTVLMFVSYNDVWWAEYKVMFEALLAAGYQVDVRSSETGSATSYQSGPEGTVQSSADTVVGGYAGFTQTFNAQFGSAWNPSWNAPAAIPVNGRIQDVTSMAPYVAFIAAGGTGAIDYAYDGSYAAQGPVGHVSSAANVQAAAERVNALIVDALRTGKPVLTQCHGARLAAFARTPGTAGQGPGGLGLSILQNRSATGFHLDATTAIDYASLGVTYLASRNVVIDGPPAANLAGSAAGVSRVITTRDWYPQTITHAASALLNILRSYPDAHALNLVRKVLIIHGGAVIRDVNICNASNQTTNDVPCNWGTNWPADYTHLRDLLAASSTNDPYRLTVSDVNLMGPPGSLPFTANNQASVLAYLRGFDTVIYFKHWATGVTPQLVGALLQFADEGGGLVALHHGLFNQGATNNLVAAFGAESNAGTWSGSTDPLMNPSPVFLNVNHGHFVTGYGTAFDATLTQPTVGFPAAPPLPNVNPTGYPAYSMGDELYLNMGFIGGPSFGAGVGQINLLLANNHVTAPAQTLTAGFSKLYNPSADATVGRLVYFQSGETIANYAVTSRYGQMIRNAVVWASLARPPCSLDIDGDAQTLAATDGLLVLRQLLGLPDAALASGVHNPAGLRTSASAIRSHTQGMIDNRALDLDGDDQVNAVSDGLMLLRILLGFTGSAVTNGAVSSAPLATRTTWDAIRPYLNGVCGTALP